MTDCGRSVVAALSRYVSGRPWTDCRSAGNTEGHVVLALLCCALVRAPSVAKSGEAETNKPPTTGIDGNPPDPSCLSASNYLVFERFDYCNIDRIL
jgi:hypothetical protein